MTIRLVMVLTSLALVTACGSGTGGGAADLTTSPADTTFPVTISRTGGIAGFNDRIVVDTGGATTVTSKRGAAGRCTLTDDTVARLLAAVSTLAQSTSQSTPQSTPQSTSQSTPLSSGPRISDEMFTTVEAPMTQGAVRLTDAPDADLAVVGEIIADVTGASPAYRLCTKD